MMRGEADFTVPCYGGYYAVRVIHSDGITAPDDDVLHAAEQVAEQRANTRAPTWSIPLTIAGRHWTVSGTFMGGTPGTQGGVVGNA